MLRYIKQSQSIINVLILNIEIEIKKQTRPLKKLRFQNKCKEENNKNLYGSFDFFLKLNKFKNQICI